MRSVPPSLSTPYLEAFDGCLEAAHRVTLGASGREIYEEELLSVRARLPDRLKGLALRRRAETAPEAFCSCVLAVAQALFDIGFRLNNCDLPLTQRSSVARRGVGRQSPKTGAAPGVPPPPGRPESGRRTQGCD